MCRLCSACNGSWGQIWPRLLFRNDRGQTADSPPHRPIMEWSQAHFPSRYKQWINRIQQKNSVNESKKYTIKTSNFPNRVPMFKYLWPMLEAQHVFQYLQLNPNNEELTQSKSTQHLHWQLVDSFVTVVKHKGRSWKGAVQMSVLH